ncbi:MAG TPA: response regulator [Rhizomicrobium sp.]|jgi:DNA-binding response OmpR family regulator
MGSDFAKTRVLLVDKTAHGRNLLRGILATLGVGKLETRADGVMALQLLRQEPYDIVFCDEWLEPMSAISFVKVLRHDVRSHDMAVPVVLVTAGTERKHVERVREAGVSDVIVKPVSVETMRRKLEAHLTRAGLGAVKQYLAADRRKTA